MRTAIVEIEYCTLCRWMLRAAWLAQELLTTFADDIKSVTLIPTEGGIFKVRVNGVEIWCRKKEDGFPEAKELKQRLRDEIDPDRDLGHSDRK
ncbi:SelT/SelW/SelH family protein [Maribrevibacterium harenarium]|uniref:SelT/SelW/SelH family protein n=1 Tax=Maribrevibacterium harenarium TaxID=2589817 RepID=A0A501X2M6_9GAMM|nr:SelT/SelW/SelH family protein [Maribrevibacterium harenarium]TPE54742.1 SelT/SelW/SelH family protein [Maribrevibacterium harenarium]